MIIVAAFRPRIAEPLRCAIAPATSTTASSGIETVRPRWSHCPNHARLAAWCASVAVSQATQTLASTTITGRAVRVE